MSLTDGLATSTPLEFGRIGPMLMSELVAVWTANANITLTNKHRSVQCIDPAAARDLTLPALQVGLWFFIANKANAAETITIKEAAGGTTVETVDQNESILLWCDGTTWHVVTIFTATIT